MSDEDEKGKPLPRTDRESYLRIYDSINSTFEAEIRQNHQQANDTTRLMLNALLLLNGGGIAAAPSVRLVAEGIKGNAVAYPMVAFFVGLVFALIAGALTVWNHRLHAMDNGAIRNVKLGQAADLYHGKISYEELESDVPSPHPGILACTFVGGWLCGVFSVIAFIVGGVTLGGDKNPLCSLLGPLCFSAM